MDMVHGNLPTYSVHAKLCVIGNRLGLIPMLGIQRSVKHIPMMERHVGIYPHGWNTGCWIDTRSGPMRTSQGAVC